MTTQQKTDLRVFIVGSIAVLMILPWIEWHEVRPSAIASIMMLVGLVLGLWSAMVLGGYDE